VLQGDASREALHIGDTEQEYQKQRRQQDSGRGRGKTDLPQPAICLISTGCRPVAGWLHLPKAKALRDGTRELRIVPTHHVLTDSVLFLPIQAFLYRPLFITTLELIPCLQQPQCTHNLCSSKRPTSVSLHMHSYVPTTGGTFRGPS
jgi:hypothetical protein